MTLNHIKKGRERGVGKKKNVSGLTATLRVILRERNLCDIDRILLKRRSSGIIQLDRLSFTHFWGGCRRDGCHMTRLASMDLFYFERDLRNIDGKYERKKM